MKKILAMILAAMMLLALAACGSEPAAECFVCAHGYPPK